MSTMVKVGFCASQLLQELLLLHEPTLRRLLGHTGVKPGFERRRVLRKV